MIPIVYCFDEYYAKYVDVSMYSVIKNTSAPVVFYCFTDFKNEEALKPILDLEKRFNLNLVIIENLGHKVKDWMVSHHITKAAYLRFFVPDMLAHDKIIYLDCDTIVRGDVAEYYNIDLEDKVAGVVWEKIKTLLSPVAQKVKDVYFNSGSLLLDLKKMREMDFLKKCADFHNNSIDQIWWHDQDIMNHVLENKKKELSNTWNFQLLHPFISQQEWDDFETAKLLHYNGPTKPWQMPDDERLSKPWWEYKNELTKIITGN